MDKIKKYNNLTTFCTVYLETCGSLKKEFHIISSLLSFPNANNAHFSPLVIEIAWATLTVY